MTAAASINVGSVTTPAGVLALGAGLVLVYSGITGQNPLTEVRKALTSGQLDGPEPDPALALDLGAPPSTDGGGIVAPSGSGGAGSGERVPIGQGRLTLNPVAAAAFARAERNYGRQITVTGTTRSYSEQAENYRRNPSRFGPPDGNAHVEGRAIDINLPALGLNPTGEPNEWLNDPAYRRLYEALARAGWCNYQIKAGTARGRTREPWHFSVGRCN